MKKVPILLVALSCCLLAAGCHQDDEPAHEKPEVTVLRDIPYGAGSLQKLDAYLPPGGSATAGAVIFIHSGSWIGGDKTETGGIYQTLLASFGYVTVAMNYRLADPNAPGLVTIGDMLDDIDEVKSFLATKESAWNCDAGRIALIGFSAGAHLALMDTLSRNGSFTVKACASFSGPTDFTDPVFQAVLPEGEGGKSVLDGLELVTARAWNPDDPDTVDWYKSWSPLYQDLAAQSAVRFLLVHGQADTFVPYASQALALKEALEAAGITPEWYSSETDGHGLETSALPATFGPLAEILTAVLD